MKDMPCEIRLPHGVLLNVFSRPITFHRCFVDLTGSTNGALMLSQAMWWENNAPKEDGWWTKTQKEWQEETGLSRHELDGAKKACRGILLNKVAGMPAQTYYRVDLDALQTGLLKTGKLIAENQQTGCQKAASKTPGKRQSTNDTKGDIEVSTDRDASTIPWEVLVWNENCGALAKVQNLSKTRLTHLKARRQEPFFRTNFAAAVEKVAASRFCNGDSDRGWRATFDWMLQPDTVTKVMEGKYDNRNGHRPADGVPIHPPAGSAPPPERHETPEETTERVLGLKPGTLKAEDERWEAAHARASA